jgi:hypothetical protein
MLIEHTKRTALSEVETALSETALSETALREAALSELGTAMSEAFTYADVGYDIPDEKVIAYRGAWEYIARPGNWWSGSERVAIAATARAAVDCELCAKRSAALSPLAVTGVHDQADPKNASPGLLSSRIIDAVHRIRTDSARLTGSWVEELIDEDFSYGHYVEMVSVIVTLTSIDSFHQVLGIPLEKLPAPEAGEPSHYLPPGASIDVAWVPMIYPENLTEAEADIYFGAPKMGNVIRALSLVPDAVRDLHAVSSSQYLPTPQVMDMSASGSLRLTRPQIELVAARTSALNDCFY